MKRLAVITTHPIQYYAPLFKLIQERGRVELKVFYTWGEQALQHKFDPGFGKTVEWDIPLLAGYPYEFLLNVAKDPGSHHFNGINNPFMFERINDFKPDAVLVIGWNFESHLKALRHFKKRIPVYFRGDSTLLDEPAGLSIRKALRRLVLRYVYRYIDIAFYTGKANKAYYLKHGLPEQKLRYAPHAVDNMRFAKTDDRQIARKRLELCIKDDELVFLFAGKFELKKDPVFLLRAFIRARMRNCSLIMAGDGALKNELGNMVLNHAGSLLAENKKVLILPFQNQTEMPVLYRLADVFVLPSKGPGETWGLAVNEAMASARPVIISEKVGCAADLLKDGINGYLFSAGNMDELKDRMTLCNEKKKCEKMGLQAKELVQDWSFENIAAAIENEMQTKG